jgi:periplasmic protein TonB
MKLKRKHLPMLIVAFITTIVGVGSFALIRNFVTNGAPQPKQVVEQIQLIRPPPPPPPTEQPPPPPPPEEKVNIPDPQQQPDPTPSNEPPPAANLGLDAEGGAGGDAFGLVGNKGGRDITATGGSAFAWYAGLLRDEILSELNQDKNIRNGQYRVTLRAWLKDDGSVARMEILHGSGDAQRDRAIEGALQHVKRVSQARPSGMPDVISFEIVARG